MTKDNLVEQIAAKTGVSKSQADTMLKAFTESVSVALSKGDSLTLTGFGTFQISNRAAREGINPRTGEKLHIPAMKVPKFKAGKALKMAVK